MSMTSASTLAKRPLTIIRETLFRRPLPAVTGLELKIRANLRRAGAGTLLRTVCRGYEPRTMGVTRQGARGQPGEGPDRTSPGGGTQCLA